MTNSCAEFQVHQGSACPLNSTQSGASFHPECRLWDSSFYGRLRLRAVYLLQREDLDAQPQPEDLMHDAYLRLASVVVGQEAKDSEHYFAIASRAMRRSLIDRVRASRAFKRFGRLKRTELSPEIADSNGHFEESLWVSDLLEKCWPRDARMSRVLRMRYIEDKSIEEIGRALHISPRTVKRDLRTATAQLRSHFGIA